MPRVVCYRALWSEDRTHLVQIFTDPDTDSILTVTVSSRQSPTGRWESTHKVGTDHQEAPHSGRDHRRDSRDPDPSRGPVEQGSPA